MSPRPRVPASSLRTADITSGAVLLALGVAVVTGALQMPIGGTYGGVDNPWYASPAAFPLLIGSLLALAGIAIATRGIAAGALANLSGFVKRSLAAPFTTTSGRAGATAFAYLVVYLVLLHLHPFGAYSYHIASSLFLAAFSLTFYRPDNRFPRTLATTVIVVAATAAAFLVAALFSGPLRVPLP